MSAVYKKLLNYCLNFIIYFNFMKTELLKILIKVLIYALSLIAAYFGVTSLTSCSTSRDVVIKGRATIVTSDTTFIDHSRLFNYSYPH